MGFRKRTDSYWARRSAERLTLAEYEMEPYLEQVIKAYEDAKREVINGLRRMYAAYYREDKSFNMIALNSIVPKGDIQRFRDEMKRRGLNTKLPDNYGGRITRLELIESQLQAKIDRIGRKTVQIEGKSHRNTVESSFYHSIYDVSKGLGATPAFAQLNEKTINKILETKFEGKNYSERIWGNTNILAQQLREKLTKAIATGQSLEKTTREFRERFGVGESYAKRLIRTETNYFENTAEIESHEAMGIEYFVFVATLDDRTSEICQSMDGKKFKVKDAVAGDNYPPLHPNCRSTIRAYIGKDYEPETRIYRDPETGRNKYTYNMSYEEWREHFVNSTQLHGISEINDGFTVFDPALLKKYDGLKPEKAPSNIFEKINPDGVYNSYPERLTIGEIDFYKRAESLGYKLELIPVSHKPTKDVKMLGINWELKTIVETGDNTIRNVIFKATDQNKRFIILDVTFMDRPMSWIVKKVQDHLAIPKNNEKISRIVVVRGKKFIRIK